MLPDPVLLPELLEPVLGAGVVLGEVVVLLPPVAPLLEPDLSK